MKDPIIIVGCARSGTSMTAGIVNICGAFGGKMYGQSDVAPKGMFENTTLRTDFVKPYLAKIGVDPKGQKPLTNNRQVFEVSSPEITAWRNGIQNMMKSQGYTEGDWFIKCTKSLTIWYLWHMAFPTAKWVIVRRDPEHLSKSCLQTRFMTAYRDTTGWKKWIQIHEKRIAEIRTAKLKMIEFWPVNMCNEDFEPAKSMIESFLELEWKENLCRSFIVPDLFSKENRNGK